jgi:hypothetical protein
MKKMSSEPIRLIRRIRPIGNTRGNGRPSVGEALEPTDAPDHILIGWVNLNAPGASSRVETYGRASPFVQGRVRTFEETSRPGKRSLGILSCAIIFKSGPWPAATL